MSDLLLVVDPEAQARERARRRAAMVADLLAAMVLAICCVVIGYCLAVYITPCEGSQLCGLAVVPTRTGLWRRAWLACRAWYLRALLASCETDLENLKRDSELMPHQLTLVQHHIDCLRVQLIDCDLGGRRN